MAQKGKAVNATGRSACTRHGLSVFTDIDSCALHRELFPYLGQWIAKADLKPDHGRLALTASSRAPLHHTWWPFEEVERHSLFTVVPYVV